MQTLRKLRKDKGKKEEFAQCIIPPSSDEGSLLII